MHKKFIKEINNTKGEQNIPKMKIFISHSSRNKNYGDLIVELLRSLGIKENEIIFTSNVAYGIPVGQNIFHWLKSQIEEKPFVVYLLSEQYYESIACLNEMGAAWIIENEHAAIFTPDFNLSSKEFQSGALDPREIGFYITDEERVLSFIHLLSKDFEISSNPILISQSVKKFIRDIRKIKPELTSKNLLVKKLEQKNVEATEIDKKNTIPKVSVKPKRLDKGDLYSKFLGLIAANKLKSDELLLLHYIVDTSNVKLMTGWQEEREVSKIREWEKINDIKDILSKNYSGVIRKFELRGFTEVSELTSSNNPKEVKLRDEIATHVLDLPADVHSIIEDVVNNNYFEHPEEVENEDDLPF